MDRVFQVREISGRLVQESKAHRVMGVSDRKTSGMMEQPPCPGEECFTKNHGRDRHRPYKPVPVIKRFGPPTQRPGEEALLIPRGFAVITEPMGEVVQNIGHCVRESLGFGCLSHKYFSRYWSDW
jgi:hypothetical protein